MKIAAVIFDLDGTLTQPYLDFDQIRSEIGNIDGPILEAMEQMSPPQRQKALEILHRHEQEAAENSCLNPGARDIHTWLHSLNIPIGLVTRNQRSSVEYICKVHNLDFAGIVTREDGPAKPDAFPILRACELMGVLPQETVVVGDYLFDLISARRAGAHPVLLTTNKNHTDFSHEADYTISSLNELPDVINNIEKVMGA
ncbi:MAG: HAD family hydrolase [Sedimentisphaerales bacterium]|nr:HAD family hydrolase [Sedimentisphaerales bacterium]